LAIGEGLIFIARTASFHLGMHGVDALFTPPRLVPMVANWISSAEP